MSINSTFFFPVHSLFRSGKRVSNDSLIMIYYHDLTIAVTELGPQKLLLGCELIEI